MISKKDLEEMSLQERNMVREFITEDDKKIIRRYLKRNPYWVTKAITTPCGVERDKILEELTCMIGFEEVCELSERVVLGELVVAMKKAEETIK